MEVDLFTFLAVGAIIFSIGGATLMVVVIEPLYIWWKRRKELKREMRKTSYKRKTVDVVQRNRHGSKIKYRYSKAKIDRILNQINKEKKGVFEK